MFIVRKHATDPKSETIATANAYNRAYDQAMTFLMDSNRDYEAFDMVEVDDDGEILKIWDIVAWEPEG
jgi:hypothetical protein